MKTIRIHTDTSIRGVPVKAGEVIEVDDETANRLAVRGDVLTPEFLEAERVEAERLEAETLAASRSFRRVSGDLQSSPDQTQTGDPTPLTRDPEPAQKKTHKQH